ncbi:MAG: amidohydrolase [Lentisphaerae bacterium]|nr:amidohydrolase [Lentisphaerota bacterium]
MSQLMLKNVILNGTLTDIAISGKRFAKIAPGQDTAGYQVIDGKGRFAVLPPFYNTHNHAAMTLLRGYADDMELFTWLHDYIWPAEAKLTGEDIYDGTRLAILEMIKSGTVFFADMYWHQSDTVRAVIEMGVRASIGMLFICDGNGELLERNREGNNKLLKAAENFPEELSLSCAPHAVYTVSEKVLREVAQISRERNLMIHIHASETRREVEECLANHNMTPIAWLDHLGLLTEKTLLAHCTHLSAEDIFLIAARKSVIAHMPVSNMKLCSGSFNLTAAVNGGCRVTIGTDGCSSNNNLSMLEEMKFAALLAKQTADDPEAGKDSLIFDLATRCGAEAFGIDAGVIAEGKLADAVLVDLNNPQMVGDYNLIANMVYSADSSVIDTVICGGRVLMQNRHVPGEEEIIERARKVCRKIAQ